MTIAAPAPGILTKVLLTGLVSAAAVTIAHLAPRPIPPYMMVNELMDHPRWSRDQTLRVHGWVEAGSIVRNPMGGRDFVLTKDGAKLRVHFEGAVADTFKDRAEVIVEGPFHADESGWIIDGDTMYAKCPTKYEGPPEREREIRFQ